jgi:predicted permease
MSIGTLWRRIRLFVHRDQATSDMQEEMRLHLELRAEQLARAGVVHADQDARTQFGNRTIHAEDTRNASGLEWLEHAMMDLRYATRRIWQKPAFAGAVIGIMALGIGAATAMFSAIDAAMLRPLPFANPAELVALRSIQVPFDPGTGVREGSVHMLDVHDVENLRDLFSQSASYAAGGLNIADDDHPVRANAGVVTVNFFTTLGVLPERGRAFVAEDGIPNAANVVIVSHNFWQNHLGGRDIAHATLSLNGNQHQVIGVMPKGFSFPKESDVWIPMSVPTTFATFNAFRGFLASKTIARLAPGVTPTSAEAKLRARWQQAVSSASAADRQRLDEGELGDIRKEGALAPLQQQLVGDKRTALLMLLGATLVLLLIACANVTNLLLSQAGIRRREMALREVLGATRGRIVRQLLVESILLAVAGAVLGVALAPIALKVVGQLLPPALVGLAPAQIDLRVLAFAAVLALVTGIVFGLWPAIGNARVEPDTVIKSGGGHGATSGKLGYGRRLLIAAELAMTIVLLVGAGLMLRSFRHVMGLDAGLTAQHVATLELSFKRMQQAERVQRVNTIIETIASSPGVVAAGAVNDLPLRGGGGISISVSVDGAPKSSDPKDMTFARYLIASGGYFDALGIRLLSGRSFTAVDDSLSPRVVIVSATMAKKYWPNASPLGRTLDLGGRGSDPVTVVGVVADVRETSLESDPEPQMYFAITQQTPANIAVVARGALAPERMLALLQNAVRRADRAQAVYNVKTMDDVVGASVAARRTNMLLITIFAGVALALSALGVYAVVAYGVAQRARELGIRAALGARASNLMTLVATELLWVSLAGVAMGLAGSWALSRLVSSMLYGISPHDPATYLLVPLTLLVPAAVAAIIPAHRASQVDPALVLRAD